MSQHRPISGSGTAATERVNESATETVGYQHTSGLAFGRGYRLAQAQDKFDRATSEGVAAGQRVLPVIIRVAPASLKRLEQDVGQTDESRGRLAANPLVHAILGAEITAQLPRREV